MIGGRRRLLQCELLLEQWAEAYARTLRPKLTLGRYRTELHRWWIGFDPQQYGLVLGGEPAAERLTRYPATRNGYGLRRQAGSALPA